MRKGSYDLLTLLTFLWVQSLILTTPTADTMADNKPTFHHMNVCINVSCTSGTSTYNAQNSQSQRILWLLEELNVEYNLVQHYRNPPDHLKAPFRSPPSLPATESTAKHPSS